MEDKNQYYAIDIDKVSTNIVFVMNANNTCIITYKAVTSKIIAKTLGSVPNCGLK